jgi:hypothetical protein
MTAAGGPETAGMVETVPYSVIAFGSTTDAWGDADERIQP